MSRFDRVFFGAIVALAVATLAIAGHGIHEMACLESTCREYIAGAGTECSATAHLEVESGIAVCRCPHPTTPPVGGP